MSRVLVIDDDPRIRQMLQRYLTGECYTVVLAGTLQQAQNAFAQQPINLVLLDLKLGSENGLDFARAIRTTDTRTPIIILSSKDDVVDKVVGLEVGADDYIAKPFHLRELLARIRAALRRAETSLVDETLSPAGASNSENVSFGNWRMARARHLVTNHLGQELPLTSKEYKLLDVFVEHPRRVLSRDQLINKVSGRSWNAYDRSIDTQVRRLRIKIEDDPSNPKLIKTIRGEGYIFSVDVHVETHLT